MDRKPKSCSGRAKGVGLELVEREPKGAGGLNKSAIIAGERNALTLFSEEVYRCQMQSIQGPDRLWKRLQSPCQYRRRQFNKRHSAYEAAHVISVRSGKPPAIDAYPNLVLEKATGDEIFSPKLFGRRSVLCEKVSQGNGGVEINQRSLRSCSSSFCNLRKDVTGLRGGGPDAASAGGVIQPLRTASDSKASASTGLLVLSGGTSSATTRSRSVTSTVSPRSARRTYSLSLFFRTFKPTAFTVSNVAPGSYLCQDANPAEPDDVGTAHMNIRLRLFAFRLGENAWLKYFGCHF